MEQTAQSSTRRTLLRHAASATIGMSIGGQREGQAQAPSVVLSNSVEVPTWDTGLKRLAKGVYAYQQAGGPAKHTVGVSNAGVIIGEDTILIIDSLGAPIHAKSFIAAIRSEAPKQPFGRMVITHHHSDHILGLPFFPRMQIVAHEYCRQAMLAYPSSKFWVQNFPKPVWAKREGWAEGGEPVHIIPPDTTISERVTYYYGSTEVRLISMAPAHTYGDVAVFVPEHKILFAGDVAFHWITPFLNNGHATSWIANAEKILEMDVETIIPGHGPIGTKKEVATMRDYLLMLKGEARKRYDGGMTPGQAAADIKLGQFAALIGAEDRMPMNVVRLYAEFKGTLTPGFEMEAVQKATDEYKAIKARSR